MTPTRLVFVFRTDRKQLSEAFGSPFDRFHVGLGSNMDRCTRNSNFRAFLAPRSCFRPGPGPRSICGHEHGSWCSRLCCLFKAGAAAYTSVALRAADGFFRRLFRRSSSRSVALDATRSDDPGSSNNFYDLSIRVARGEMPPDERRSHRRQSSSEVAPNDYVIVHPFFCGVTFERYYKATASWTTLPPLDDYTLQRYDLFKAKMQNKGSHRAGNRPDYFDAAIGESCLAYRDHSVHRTAATGNSPGTE